MNEYRKFPRRRHSAQFKREVLAACDEPGASIAGVALAFSLNANLVRKIYEGDDSRIDSAFTIYYMAVNVGSTVSMLATPAIKDRLGGMGVEMAPESAEAFHSRGLLYQRQGQHQIATGAQVGHRIAQHQRDAAGREA